MSVFGPTPSTADKAHCLSLPRPPHPPNVAPIEPAAGKPCGLWANHVDHVDPRLGTAGSALKPSGSTRRWRRIRAWVLDRDQHRCQVLVDAAGEVVEAPRPETPPTGPDDVAWLRATCSTHNLSRGASSTDARPSTPRRHDRPTDWSW